eukprot:gene17312-20603_t
MTYYSQHPEVDSCPPFVGKHRRYTFVDENSDAQVDVEQIAGHHRDGSKKSGEIRVSEDFYARMESDVKSLVKTLHPGHRSTKGDDNEESLFSVSKAKSHDSQTKKRKRPESQPTEERQEQSDADEPR